MKEDLNKEVQEEQESKTWDSIVETVGKTLEGAGELSEVAIDVIVSILKGNVPFDDLL